MECLRLARRGLVLAAVVMLPCLFLSCAKRQADMEDSTPSRPTTAPATTGAASSQAQPAGEWHLVTKGKLAKVEVERTLYDKPGDPHFLIRVRVTNSIDRAIGIDLHDPSETIYPNQWGWSETSHREVINEGRRGYKSLSVDDQGRLLEDFRRGRLVPVPPGKAVDYYREFNAESVERKGDFGKYLIISLDGQLLMTDGTITDQITCEWAMDSTPGGKSHSDTELVIPAPVRWKTVPADGRIVEYTRAPPAPHPTPRPASQPTTTPATTQSAIAPTTAFAKVFEELLADQGGASWETFKAFLAETKDQPAVRLALADALVKRALDGPAVGLESAPRQYLHNTYYINMLKAMCAREHLRELLGPNRRYQSAFELGCCVGGELVDALVAQGQLEDAWLLVKHIQGRHFDGQAKTVHQALCQLTGTKATMPVIPSPATKAQLEARDLALAAMWTDYLAKQSALTRVGSQPATTRPSSSQTQPGEGTIRPVLALKYRRDADLLAFSPDSRILASNGFHTIRLTEVQTGRLVRVTDGKANSMAFSPDGKHLVIGSGGVRVLGIPTLVEEQVLPVTQWSIYAVTVSPDSTQVAACAADGTVQVWDIQSARKLRTLGSKGERMSALAFSPDGKLLATLSRYGRCDVWNLETENIVTTAARVGNEVGELRFGPDGGTLAIASRGTAIHLWNLRTDKGPTQVKVPDVLIGKPRINGIGFSPPEGRPMNAPLGDFALGPASISPDLRTAVCTLENGKIALWDVSTRRVLCILPTGHVSDLFGGGVEAIAFSPNGELLATGNRSGDVEVWQLKGDKLLAPATQPIEADGIPGPWGSAIDGLRTRLILMPVKPGQKALEGRPVDPRCMPMSEGVWWKVCLQVRNETNKKLTVVWPEIRRPGGIVITRDDDEAIAYHALPGDNLVTRQIPIPVLPGDVSTMNSILLGRNHDLSQPGKYRIQFPQTRAEQPIPETITNPTLPASNMLEFENTIPASQPDVKPATAPATVRPSSPQTQPGR